MAVINLASLTDLERTDYVLKGLPFAKPNLVYSQFGQTDRVAKRAGKTRQWFRFTKSAVTSGDDFTGSATYVKNSTGAPPTFTPATPTDTTVTAQVDFLFSKGYEWNEGVEYTYLADLPEELRKLSFQHAAEVIDYEVKTVVVAGTNVIYANGRATRPNILSTDYSDMEDFFAAGRTLQNNDAPKINGLYRAVISPDVQYELMQSTTFQTAIQFQKPYTFTGTIAEIYGIGFTMSSQAANTTSGGSASQIAYIDQSMIFGQGAYGITKWKYDDFDTVYTSPGGWGDEYSVRHGLTWKYQHKAVILNNDWMVRLESARRA
jgi:N4-gp56 family major capsid protein